MGQFSRSLSGAGQPQSSTSGPANNTPEQIIDIALKAFGEQEDLNFDSSDVTHLLTALAAYRQSVAELQIEYTRMADEHQEAQKDSESLEADNRTLREQLTAGTRA